MVTEAGYAAYLVEEVTDAEREGHDEDGAYRLFRLECTKLDPADVEAPDWVLRPD